MSKKVTSQILIAAGAAAYFFPAWQGVFIDAGDVTVGEARIVATIMLVGGLVLFYLPEKG